jgi:hypothetical protein
MCTVEEVTNRSSGAQRTSNLGAGSAVQIGSRLLNYEEKLYLDTADIDTLSVMSDAHQALCSDRGLR